MATIVETNELDVLEKYQQLVLKSLDGTSVYIRTRETLEDMFDKGRFTAREKGEILSQVLGSLNTSVVSASMSTALQWATTEKDIALRKLELAKTLDLLDKDILIKNNQADTSYYDSIARQADTIRSFGTPIVVNGVVTSLPDNGKAFYDIETAKQQSINIVKEGTILDTKEKEAEAAVHKLIADTYVNYGKFTYTVDDTGLTSVTDATPITHTPLSTTQRVIAEEQAKGYAYNAWANAINGASSFLGTAIAGEAAIFGDDEPGKAILANLETAIFNLKEVLPPEI